MAVSVLDLDRTQEDTTGDCGRSPVVTEDDRASLDLVIKAMHRSGYSHKAAAYDMGIDRGLLSAQLAGMLNKHLSFRRMWRLSPEFWRELLVLVAECKHIPLGQTPREAEEAVIGRLLKDVILRSMGR